jgi:hypothetical protein
MSGERSFHRGRRMFVLFEGLPVLGAEGDTRSHKEWVESLGEPMADLASGRFARGYIHHGNIVFYQGEDFAPIPTDEIMGALRVMWRLKWIYAEQVVCNGVEKGVVGEVWPVKDVLGFVRDLLFPEGASTRWNPR